MTNPSGPASPNSGTSRARTGTVTVVSQYAPSHQRSADEGDQESHRAQYTSRLAGVEAY
jgi:hypothetical protein